MSDGVSILLSLLLADGALTAMVPPAQIVAGVLGLDTALDAIAVTRVSAVDGNISSPGATRHVTERVQVTVLAATYPRLKAVLRAVKTAAADRIGTIAGAANVTVHTDPAGPDFMDDQASIHMGSQDFIVGYSEVR